MNNRNNTWLAFIALVIIGGSNAVAVRFSNQALPPFWGAALRFGAAGLIYWIIVVIRRMPVPRGRALGGAMLFGLLTVGANYALIYWGILQVPAGMTMVLLATVPLLTFFFAILHKQERFRWWGLLGALVSLSGILVIAWGQLAGAGVPTLPMLAILLAAACLAEGSVLYKGYPKIDPVITNAISTTTGALMLAVLSLVVGEEWLLTSTSASLRAILYLVIFGSVLLFYLYLFVLTRWTASATAYSFLLFPLATVLLAAWLLDEKITPAFIAGGLLVTAGVWLGVIYRPRAELQAAEQARVPSSD